jgi:tetratricopeptide (TPR) repeat protein
MRITFTRFAGALAAVCASVVIATDAAAGQATPAPAAPKTQTKAPAKAGAPAGQKARPAESPAFLAAKKAGDAALAENRLDDAVAEYYKALKIQPDWAEGWWHLGLISYEQDKYEPARDALRRVAVLNGTNAKAWGIMGLSEFQLKEYDPGLTHLQRARQLGVVAADELAPVIRYHTAILLTRMGMIDQGLQVLNEFAVEGNDSPKVVEAFGVAALRLPMLPTDVPGERRDAIMMAGRAQYFSASRLLPAAKQAFEQLVIRYPELPNAHYAYGTFLLGEEPDLAIEELQKELKVTPGHSLAMLALAFEYIRRSDYATAKTWAEKATTVDPNDFAAHKALGQVLLETGDTEGAIRELEAGVKLAPTSPVMHFQLAKAYQKAGRGEDAERERAEFTKLDRALRAARTGSQSLGGVENTPAPQTPNQQD